MQTDSEKFDQLESLDWKEKFFDSGCGNWQDKWFMDGYHGSVRNTEQGMLYSAGPIAHDDASHSLLWTKDSFEGNIRIEWDYTRCDNAKEFVNIVYIQAQGRGEGVYEKDITKWNHLRCIPYMRAYLMHMNALHLSYATIDTDLSDYLRVRRYPMNGPDDFDSIVVDKDYMNTGLFLAGVTYHFVIIKDEKNMLLKINTVDDRQVENYDSFYPENPKSFRGEKIYTWDLSAKEPVREGRVGIRHMCTRSSLYKNIRISTL